jgi:hypothetical protein
MSFLRSGRHRDYVKLPNHAFAYGLILAALGALTAAGSVIRLYELRDFLPLRLPKEVNEYILDYIPFILGTFITTTAAVAGVIVGSSWLFRGLKDMGRLSVPLRRAGDYHRADGVSLGLKEGRIRSYEESPSLIFYILGRLWSNAAYVSQIPGEIVRANCRFLWKAIALAVGVHFLFKLMELLPPYFDQLGLGAGYVIPSPQPFYNLLGAVCLLKILTALTLIPLKKPGGSREMDSMIVEGRGHPLVFFAILEEGSKIFAQGGFPNRIKRTDRITCEDGETMVGTLMESFPEYVRTTPRAGALLSLLVGSVMVLVGFLQIVLMQYPTFSIGYADFFRLRLLSLFMDLFLNVAVIALGKGFLDQARCLMSVYRYRSSLVYVEAKGDFDDKEAEDLRGIVSDERLFNPLSSSAFNVRYFSAEAISESVTPEGVRELTAFETSGRLAKDVSRLKYLPFQVEFRDRYPSSWEPAGNMGTPEDDDDEDEVIVGEHADTFNEEKPGELRGAEACAK